MSTFAKGQPIGLLDSLLREICVGDVITDAKGSEYSIDKYGRAVPLPNGNPKPLKNIIEPTVTDPWVQNTTTPKFKEDETGKVKPAKEEEDPELKKIDDELAFVESIQQHVKAAGDQRLVDELRQRGWTVTCTKLVEKIVYEEVTL